MRYTILHCADVHLDTSFTAGGLAAAVDSWRRTDLRATLGRILTLARERRVDAVTIAGDLYEQDYALPDTAAFLVQQFTRLAPTRVFIAPGEQDPYTSDSLYALTSWPDNVTIFSQNQLVAVELVPGTCLWGAACPAIPSQKGLGQFWVDRKGTNLLLLHATDTQQTRSGGGLLFEVDADTVRSAGFDFALLGHRHVGRLWPADAPCCAYPGSPEPLVPEEADGAHQVVLLTIQNGICTPELVPTGQWRYHTVHADLSGCESTDEAARRVTEALLAIRGGTDSRTLCTAVLTGDAEFDLNLADLKSQVDSKAHIHYDVQFSFPYNLEQLAQEQTARGLLVRRFQTRLEETKSAHERALARSALLCALRVLDGKQVIPDEVC